MLPASVRLTPGDTLSLAVAVFDAQGNALTGVPVSFQSDGLSVATVSSAGFIRAIALGTANITVSAGPLSSTVAVTVVVGAHPVGLLDQTVTLGLRPYGVAVSSAGAIYVTQLDGATVSRAQLPTVAFASAISVGQVPTDVAFNSTGTTAYVTNQFSSNVGVIDVAAGRQVDSIPLASGTPFRVLVSADDRTVYVSTNNGAVIAFDAATKALKAQYYLSGAINGLALPPSGPLLYATDFLGGALYEINTSTGVVRGAYAGGAPQDVAVSLDGTTLYVADEGGALQVRSVATGGLLTTVPAVTGAFALKLSPDGTALWVGSTGTGSIQVVNTATLAAQTIATGVVPRRIAFSQEGTRAVVANEGGSVLIFK